MRIKPLPTGLLFTGVLLLGGLWIWLSLAPANSTSAGQIPAPQKGFLAPDFQLQKLEGGGVRLSSLRGRVVLLNVWATWCPPCRAEMPAMQRVQEQYGERGLVILAVNATQDDSPAAVQAFVQEYGLTFPVLMDSQGEVAKLYEVRSLPTSFFIDTEGVIQEVVLGGPMAEALLRIRIEGLLPPLVSGGMP